MRWRPVYAEVLAFAFFAMMTLAVLVAGSGLLLRWLF
jgi:hypothetical protein